MKLPELPSNLVSISSRINEAESAVTSRVLSADEKIKENILKTVLPDSLFTAKLPGTDDIDFERIEEEINNKISVFASSVKIPSIPALPKIPLIPKIPPITIPSPAELTSRAQKLIAEKKQKLQEQQLKSQIAAAIREESPFSNRKQIEQQKNNLLRKRFGPQR
jgi:hypothetical protein